MSSGAARGVVAAFKLVVVVVLVVVTMFEQREGSRRLDMYKGAGRPTITKRAIVHYQTDG